MNEKYLRRIDLTDPQEVIENVFQKYTILNNKKLTSDKWEGWRYISKNRVKFTLVNKLNSEQYCVGEFKVTLHGKDILLPFPAANNGSYWFIILDSQNYEYLNLPEYKGLHPIIDHIINDGKTYLILINPNSV